jgi:hypothetical protein
LPELKEMNCFSIEHLLSPPFLDTNLSFIETFLNGTDALPTLAELDNWINHKGESSLRAVQTACYSLTTTNESGLNIKILQTVYFKKPTG